MAVLGSLLFLLALLVPMAAVAHRRPDHPHRRAAAEAWGQLRPLAVRIPLALVAAGFIAELLPPEQVVALLGEESGTAGVIVATAVGAILPGGPMVAFPLAVVLFESGAGVPQMVALITAWSVLAVNRVLVFELPLLGGAFTGRRLLASLVLAPAAGGLAALATWFIPPVVLG